jgi:uncharacterized protein (TIGR00255 family)
MIRSMTGYGRAEVSGPRLSAAVECRSVNHRHLDIALKLPRALAIYEPDARRLVQAAVQRGRVDVSATLTPVGGGLGTTLSVNTTQAREYAAAARALADELRLTATLRIEWLLAQPGVLTRDAEPTVAPEEGWTLVAQALEAALADLVARREAEGKALAQELGALHETLEAEVALVAARVPVAQTRRVTRLRERVQALLGEIPVDQGRLATEVAALAERADITEELARLRVHLGELRARIDEGGQVGRPLDFLIQEINREVNTVGSKADDLEISQAVIAAKATLEKVREQVQNIE